MSDPSFPDIEQLVPHRGPALWLSRVLDHDPDGTACEACVPAAHPLARDGALPGVAAMEWMAQATAAHSALRGRAGGVAEIGVVAGIAGFTVDAPGFAVGLRPVVRVVQVEGGDGPMAQFDGEVSVDGRAVARGRVTVVRGEAATGGAA